MASSSASNTLADRIQSVQGLEALLRDTGYLVDDGLATALYLAAELRQPLLLEGEPGVGKTAAAKAMAEALGVPFMRLQCYEGISAAEALYEWNYPRQMLSIRLADGESAGPGTGTMKTEDLFSEDFLVDRPLLAALRCVDGPPVLLIDEIDRADDEFEALLFEFLGEHAITIPEIGTITTDDVPIVILTSNRSRELHDALKRRCLYHWIDYPSTERAADIVRTNVPTAASPLVEAATAFVGQFRQLELDKPPGLAETIDWVSALKVLGVTNLDASSAASTLGSVAKTPDDLQLIRQELTA